MELNREQIIKALEYCFNDKPCNGCEWHEVGNGCIAKLEQSALSLINELTEENERLRSRNNFLEIEYKNQGNLFWARVHDAEDGIKADTVRKIADFIWNNETEGMVIAMNGRWLSKEEFIDQIAEEIIGETKQRN